MVRGRSAGMLPSREAIAKSTIVTILCLLLIFSGGLYYWLVLLPRPVVEKIVISQKTDLTTLDPHGAADSPTITVLAHTYEPLIKTEFVEGELRFVPWLAESYEFIDDVTLELRIREGVKFHDGSEFNASVVKFNIERVLNPKVSKWAFLLEAVEKVEVVDEYTVRLITKYPFGPLISNLAHLAVVMVPPTAPMDEPITNPIGTGPYKFVEWIKGEKALLERFEGYWGEKPPTRFLEWKPIADDASRIAALEAGVTHIVTHVPPHEIERLRDIGFNVISMPSTRTIFVCFNVTYGPLADARVRRAIFHAINREAIVEHILLGAGTVATSFFAPGILGYKEVSLPEYDPDKAKELLVEAGYAGEPLSLIFSAPRGRYLMDEKIAEAVAFDLGEVGIEVTLEVIEFGALLEKILVTWGLQMWLLGWSTVTLDADYALYPWFHSTQIKRGAFNTMMYSNPEVDRLLSDARATLDPEIREGLYAEALEMLAADLPVVPLHYENIVVAMAPELEGVFVDPRERIVLDRAYIIS